MSTQFILLLVSCLFSSPAYAAVTKTTYTVDVVSAGVERFDPEWVANGTYLRVIPSSVDQQRRMHGTFKLLRDFDYQVKSQWKIAERYGGTLKEEAATVQKTFCSQLEGRAGNIIFKYSTWPKKCPVPEGEYTWKDFTIDVEDLLSAGGPEGQWLFRDYITVDGKEILVFFLEAKFKRLAKKGLLDTSRISTPKILA